VEASVQARTGQQSTSAAISESLWFFRPGLSPSKLFLLRIKSFTESIKNWSETAWSVFLKQKQSGEKFLSGDYSISELLKMIVGKKII
jgi:hypothetical protein